VMIWDMVIDRGATTLAVFTRSRGAFAWPLPTSGTTAVTAASFTGRAAKNGVRISWRTASETNAVGFHVWRLADGKATRVNAKLIAAKAAGRSSGAAYSLLDRTTRRGSSSTYRLQVVRRDGTRAWVARAVVRRR
jgi:hypothetical protein